MTEYRQRHVFIDPQDVDHALQQLGYLYDVDKDTQEMLRPIIALYPRPADVYADDSSVFYYSQMPLVDRFTFNMQTDELVLFSTDPLTIVDAMLEMAMYLVGFSTLIGVEDYWKIEFAIGAWKPVRNTIKRELGLPVLDEPLWAVGSDPQADADEVQGQEHPFRKLVAQLDTASFTQMTRLAAREDVEVHFPQGCDPKVIEVYIRMRTAMYQVSDGISLADWRTFNRRLVQMVQDLEAEYQPEGLPEPHWWQLGQRQPDDAVAAPEDSAAGAPSPSEGWDPFASYIKKLFGDETDDAQGAS